MNVKNMETAVRDEIAAFVANGCEFSAHSITTNVRTKVNSGNLEIDGLPKIILGVNNTQYIGHQTVRAIVDQLFANGDIRAVNYDRRWQVASNQNGGYLVYGPAGSNVAPQPSSSVYPVQNAMASQSGATCGHADPRDPVVVQSVLDYFDHRFSGGDPATLKSTQSRLKRSPLFVTDIAQIAISNGYLVVPVIGRAYSESIVKPGTQTVAGGYVSNS